MIRSALLSLALMLCGLAHADKYGVDEAMAEGAPPGGAGVGVVLWCAVLGAAAGYAVGRDAHRRDPSKDPIGYAIIGMFTAGPALLLAGVLLGWWR
jgi:hypothetical protein